MTCASDGSELVGSVTALADFSQSAFAFFAVATQAAGDFQPPSRASSASSPALASATSGSALCLPASKSLSVQPDDLDAVRLEQRPGAGGEVLQPRADRQHHVRLLGEQVGGRRAGDADRAHVERMHVRQARLAGLRLHDRHAVFLGEGLQRRRRLGIKHAAAGDDDRLLRGLERGDRRVELGGVGLRAARRPDTLGEKAFRIVEGLGLHVLAERQRHRAAFGRIGQHLHGAVERRDDLLGPRDAVEIARHGAEAVVGADGAVAETFHLLQHRIGRAVGEDVAGKQQHRQAVDVGECCGRHHVGRARADRGRRRHEAAAETRLGEGDRGMRHRLLVVRAVGRQLVADLVERLADAGDIAMAEDRPDAAEDRQLLAVDHGHLPRHEAGQRLRHRQADGFCHRRSSI